MKTKQELEKNKQLTEDDIKQVTGGKNNEPIIIDDFKSESLPGLKPTDIEEIDILKDASAGAIYDKNK